MVPLRSCRSIPTGARIAARAALLCIACVVSACASNTGYRQDAAGVAGPPQRVASAPVPELEDDGLPGQVSPPPRAARDPDDPSEPFSPNYGAGQSRSDNRAAIADSRRIASAMTTPR